MYNVSVKHIVGKKFERSVKDMNKKMNKFKSAVLSGMIAVGSVAGSFAAVAPSLSASAASTDNYAKLLQYSLYFYDANMCGTNVGERSALTWRDDCHTSDAVDGGFHDAGDHVKFGLPAGYAASVLGLSYHEFGDAFDSTGQTAHLKVITDHFAEFFKNSTTLSGGSVTEFVYQIGDGNADHAEWCAPEMQGPSSRTKFSTNSGASDIAAEYAAALAANYVNFGNEEDLTYAKALFDFSTKYNKKATDGVGGFYDSWDYYDDQAWAAGWLYLATKDNTYKSFLNTYMNTSDAGSSGMDGGKWGIYSTLSWNNVSMGAGILQAEINGGSDDWNKVTTYLDSHGGNSSEWYWENMWGSARYNTAQQTAALIASKHGAKDYYSWAAGQMDYILGNSPSGKNLVVGMESNSSQYPHHRAASGYSSFDEMGDNTTYSSNGHVLVGALCGGPEDKGGTYHDSVKDYYCNEVTLDYNATLVAAAAGLYSKYKTGEVVDTSSIPGVDGSAVTPIVTTAPQGQVTTTVKSDETPVQTTTTKADTPQQTTAQQGSTGSDKEAKLSGSNGEYTFNPENADTIEITLTMNSGDTQGNGGIGFSDAAGNWTQVEFNLSISGGKGTATVSGEKLKGVSNAKLMIWWPESATIDSVVLHYNNSTPAVTTAAPTTTAAPVTTAVPVTTQTESVKNDSDIVYGDANLDGKVTISDAVAILQYLANSEKYPLSEQARKNADVDGEGGVTGKDAAVIQKVDAGIYAASQLPIKG